jgi:hypothetical protein
MVEAANDFLNQRKNQFILTNRKTLTKEKLEQILSVKIRTEKIAIKDAKLRTFIMKIVVEMIWLPMFMMLLMGLYSLRTI